LPDANPIPPASCSRATRTAVCRAAESGFEGGLRAFFEYRDLGIREATRGAFGAHVIRAVPGKHPEPKWHAHDLAFQMVYVLKGWVRFEYEDIGEVELRPGDRVHQPPRVRHREIAHSDDLELIEITGPAEFATAPAEAPEGRAAALDRARATG
jgi:quercetin dioxygenase-like cupin family protein